MFFRPISFCNPKSGMKIMYGYDTGRHFQTDSNFLTAKSNSPSLHLHLFLMPVDNMSVRQVENTCSARRYEMKGSISTVAFYCYK